MDAVLFAEEIISMRNEICYLREELIRLGEIEKKYYTLLDSSLLHSQEMSNQVIKLIVNKGSFDKKPLPKPSLSRDVKG